MKRDGKSLEMVELRCTDCNTIVEHPVGEPGQKTLCEEHMFKRLRDVDML